MRVRFISVQIPTLGKVLAASCKTREMLRKGGKLQRKRLLSMLQVMLLLSYTATALVGGFLIPKVAAQEPTVTMWVTPQNRVYEIGDVFSITIWLNDTADEYGPYDVKGWGFTINFDGSILEYVGATQGSYLKNYGNTFFVAPSTHTIPVSLVCIITSHGVSAEGPGDLATVTFRVVGNGRTVIDLKDTELGDSSSAAIPQAEPVDGWFYTTYPRARFYYLPSTMAQSIAGIFFPFHLNRDPLVNETVSFNATAYILWGHFFGSYDPDTVTEGNQAGAVANYTWDFDDGNVTSGIYPTITHSFNSTAFYYVKLTVTDEEGKSAWFNLGVTPVIHDVGVSPDMEITPQAVRPGKDVSITVNIENMGSSEEYVNVTLFSRFNGSDTLIWYNQSEGKSAFSTPFEIDPVSRTYPLIFWRGESIAVNYTWSTTGLPEGIYELWANVSLVERSGTKFLKDVYLREMDFNVTNNLRFGGIVTLTETALIPVAYFTFSPFNPVVGTPVTFDATFSYDPDGEIVSYEWDFGDGWNGTGMIVYHVYNITGTYFATLTVIDQDNLRGSMHAVIAVVPAEPEPTTSIYIDPVVSLVGVGETFTVDVRVQDVQDLIGFEFYIQWNSALLEFVKVREGSFLNSSGAYQTYFVARYPGYPGWSYTDTLYAADTLLAPQMETTASGSGVLARITFRVLTPQGNGTLDLHDSILLRYDPFTPREIAHTSKDGYFVVIPGQLPIAMFTYSPSEPVVNQTVSFDASASYDPNGTIVGYEWIFGDGSPPVSVGGPFITHTYSWAGNFTVILTVIDNDGLRSSTTEMIIIFRLPSAISISASPANVMIGGSTAISGAISPARAWAQAMILYRHEGAEYWSVLAYVSSDEYGEYSYKWYPHYDLGTYELKAVWYGDGQYEGSESEIITVNVLLPQPIILIFPAQGSVGAKIEVYGGDFPADQPIYLTFDDQLVGFLYTDEQGNLSAAFSVPLSAPGLHKVKAWTIFYYGNTRTISAEASFTVIDVATLDVNADVGSIFFNKETAEFYVEVALRGVAVNATSMNAQLRKPDGTEETLATELIGTGLYRIRYLINGKGTVIGTYTLVIEADYVSEVLSAHGTTIKTFLVKSTWERQLPRMAAVSVASIGLASAMILVWRKEKKKFL